MGNMQRHLYNLGVFDKVDTAIHNPEGDEEEKYVAVDLHVRRRPHPYALAVGVGAELAKIGGSATSISNPTGTTGFAPRFDLQLSRLNLWGLGQSVTLFNGRYLPRWITRRASRNSTVVPRFRNVQGHATSR